MNTMFWVETYHVAGALFFIAAFSLLVVATLKEVVLPGARDFSGWVKGQWHQFQLESVKRDLNTVLPLLDEEKRQRAVDKIAKVNNNPTELRKIFNYAAKLVGDINTEPKPTVRSEV